MGASLTRLDLVTVEKRLLLVDGHSLAYRAFYALPVENFSTASGQATNAIYGFTSMLINLIKEEKPTHIATAFDVSRKTFRSERFPEYKANRSATPDEFRSQMGFIFESVSALGIRHFAMEGFEADDIIATISTHAAEQGYEVLICTGDRDSFQLVNENITVLYPKKGMTDLARMTPAAVEEKYGLTPLQYPDFAALRGDPSDNLPSVPGVGEKTATKWIQEYGNLDGLLEHADEITGKVGDSLRGHLDAIRLNRELTQLRHDLSFGASVTELEWTGVDFSKLNALMDQLEIKALKEKAKLLGGGAAEVQEVQRATMDKATTQEITNKELTKILSGRTTPIALFAEVIDSSISAIAVAVSESQIYTVMGSPQGEWLADSSLPKWVHGGKDFARSSGIQGITFDTELAAYLINPGGRNLEVADLSQRYLGQSVTTESEDLFTSFDGSLAAVIYCLVPVLAKEIEDRNMGSLLTDLEIPTMIELAAMERDGIAVDGKKLNELAGFFRGEVERETAAAHKEAGREFNVGSPKQLQVILFDELGLPKTKKIKTGFTTDAESLETLFAKTAHPILAHLLRIRETTKLLTTIDGLAAATASDGRIHTTFQQTVTATGRLSSTDPNLQNIPVRTEEGRRIRDCFVAAKPYVDLLTADYSQIEMRIMAHLSKDAALIEAFKSGEDLHTTVGAQVFGVKPKDVDPEMRRQIKAMSYGLAYGLSAFGLSQQLNLSPTEAAALMGSYFDRFGGIRDYLKTVVIEARERGYTETILGRRRYLPDLNSENRQQREVAERMALNAPIQGSAADIMKVAMLNVVQAMRTEGLTSRLLLQVHDELIFEIAAGESEKLSSLVEREMSAAVELSLPLDVNIGIGKSWDLAAH
jgi:DNA polymerase-1